MFPQFVVEYHIFVLYIQRSVSPFILTSVVSVEPGRGKLSLTADEPGKAARESVGQVFPVLTDGCQCTGSGTLSSGLLQIRLL